MNSQDKIIRRRLIQPRQLPPKVHGSLPDFIAICLGLSELRYRWSCRDQKVRANMLHHYSTYAPLIYVLRSLGSASTSRVQSRVDCGQQARASALTSQSSRHPKLIHSYSPATTPPVSLVVHHTISTKYCRPAEDHPYQYNHRHQELKQAQAAQPVHHVSLPPTRHRAQGIACAMMALDCWFSLATRI